MEYIKREVNRNATAIEWNSLVRRRPFNRHGNVLGCVLYVCPYMYMYIIVNYPHMDSNIPSKPAYGVFISQLIRYLRVCGNYQHFVYRSVQITTRLQRQGFDYVVLCNTFKKFLQRHPIVLRKYQRSHRQMIEDCVCLPLCVFSTKNKHVTVR